MNCSQLDCLTLRILSHHKCLREMHTASIAVANHQAKRNAELGFSASRTKKKQWQEVLDLLEQGSIPADSDLYARLLLECAKARTLEEGKRVHNHIARTGFPVDILTENILVNMYAKCGSLENSRQVFDKMPKRDVASWTAMITGYAQNGQSKEALNLFCQMQRVGIKPNRFTFPSVLRACGNLMALERGKQVHAHVITTGAIIDVVSNNVLIDMYSKCKQIGDAYKVFDKISERDVISWNAMLAGYSQNGLAKAAMELFRQMRVECVELNQFAFSSAIKACATMAGLEEGRQVHCHIVKTEFDSDVFVGSSLVDMYAKCAKLEYARQVFDRIPEPNVVTWTTMIAGHVQSNGCEEALKLYCQLPFHGIKPDEFVFSSILSACASLSALEQGMQIHAHIVKTGFESQKCAGNSLIEMYSKSGCLKDAQRTHDLMPAKDVVSWTAMVAGYAQYGDGSGALQVFEQMQQAGVKPNNITFVCVLSACSHAGLVDEGRHYFEAMFGEHGIMPTSEHYACMVDLLGRAGRIKEAEELINKMPVEPSVSVWGALLGACRVHGDMELGKRAAENLLKLKPQCAGTHVLLSNIYAAAGRWDDVARVRKLMKDRGVKKETGVSWIEVRNTVHAFAVGDSLHPDSEKIYAMLETLTQQMKDAGYSPDTNCVLRDVEEEQKERILQHHSEKLALAFGLITSPPGATIRIKKNLRVCDDCHSSIKFISKIVGREIIVRDTHRFHVFSGGLCSCKNYW